MMNHTVQYGIVVLLMPVAACSNPHHGSSGASASSTPIRSASSAVSRTSGVLSAGAGTITGSKSVTVSNWLHERGIEPSRIIGDVVPTGWLCPRTTPPQGEPECFTALVGVPPQEGLVCRQPLLQEAPSFGADFSPPGTWLLSVWRVEQKNLRRVLEVRTLCEPEVRIEAGKLLSIEVECNLMNGMLYQGESSPWEYDDVTTDSWMAISNNRGEYEWKGTEFVHRPVAHP